MVCTTYLHQSKQNKPTSDNDLNELLEEIRLETNENWQAVERTRFVPRFLRKPKVTTELNLYVEVGGCLPFQELFCVRTHREAKAYLLGLLEGLRNRDAEAE